jgi:CubicO group peptidase (beta-lactamase class C family)
MDALSTRTQVEGVCERRFEGVKSLLQSFLDSGEELGANIVVNVDGEDVVDIWGGHADAEHTRKWEKDTITNVWSTSKLITSFAALKLISRGLLSPTEKVATYWPEFGANGKENIEVRHILSHTSGVSGWEKKMTIGDICDVPTATALLAQQKPFWEPGTASGYHSITLGHLIGELVLRTTGKTLNEFITEEIAAPVGADFRLGAAEKDWSRIADLAPPPYPAGPASMPSDSIPAKSMANPPVDARIACTAEWKRAKLGAVNGHANARGVVRILSAISCGGYVGQQQILKPATVDLIFEEQSRGKDLVVGETLSFGIGYALSARGMDTDWLPEGRICFWGGWGGSFVVMDLDRRVTIAYVMNKMENVGLGNNRTKAYIAAAYRALGVM